MTPAELLAILGKGKSPFRPFRLRLKDGRTFDIDEPEGWAISRSGGSMNIVEGPKTPTVMLSAEQIESVEPYNPELEADLKIAREAIARIEAGEPTIPWEQVKAELGLDVPPS